MSSDPGAWKKWGALVVFAVQNAGAVLLMRYSKLLKAAPYNNLAAVMMQELVKLVASTVLYAVECGGPGFMVGRLQTDLKENWNEWVQLGVPALLYTLQNVMLFVGAAHLEAAIQQVTYQTKIFFTAIFSVVLLGKKLTTNQWLSLLLLVVGVLCVQGVADMLIGAPPASPPAVAAPSDAAGRSGHVHNLIKKGARRGHQYRRKVRCAWPWPACGSRAARCTQRATAVLTPDTTRRWQRARRVSNAKGGSSPRGRVVVMPGAHTKPLTRLRHARAPP